MSEFSDKIKGALLGYILGDSKATGTNCQVSYNFDILSALTDLISKRKDYDEILAGSEYIRVVNMTKRLRLPSKNIMYLFKNVKYFGYLDRYNRKKTKIGTRLYTFESNDAMNRALPLACYCLTRPDDIFDVSNRDCSITNPTDIAKLVNQVYIATLLCFIIDECSQSEILDSLIEQFFGENEYLDSVLNAVKTNTPLDLPDAPKAWCVTALYQSLDLVFNKESFSLNGIHKTNYTIAGCLWGAKYGYISLMRNKNIRIYMARVFDCDAANGRDVRSIDPIDMSDLSRTLIKISGDN